MTAIGPWDAAVVIAKALTYAATLGAAGGVAFLVYGDGVIPPDCKLCIRRVQSALLVVALLASVAKILVLSASMAGDASGLLDSALTRMILQTGEGPAVLARLCGLTLLGAAIIAHRPPTTAALLGASLAATSFAWVGHVHALGRPWLWTAVLAVHLAGVGFWLGALMPLWLIARRADSALTAVAAARFGAAAVMIVGILVAAGVSLLCVLLQNPAELRSTGYGRLALSKIASVALLLALAALNRLRLTPRMRARDASAAQAFGRSVLVEIVLALIILSITAAMTTLTGPGGD
jgi:putative copper resistance protein D